MAPKWIIALVTAFIILSLLSGMLEQQYLGGGECGWLCQLLKTMQFRTINNPLDVVITFVTTIWNVMKLLWKALLWDFAFFTGYWVIVKYAFFWPLSVGLVFSILMALRGVSSG